MHVDMSIRAEDQGEAPLTGGVGVTDKLPEMRGSEFIEGRSEKFWEADFEQVQGKNRLSRFFTVVALFTG